MNAPLEIPVAILAGGLATRLRPITEKIPKSLVPVAGKPFLAHQLELLHSRGIRRAVLCVGYLGEMIRREFGNGEKYGVNLEYSLDGEKLLGTGGAIKRALSKLGEEFFLLNTSEVLAFQADGEVVWILTAKQRYLATQSLRKIQEKLEGGSFRRVHRNALVNVDHVRKLAALSSNRWLITLSNNQEFVVSKRMARNVRQILSW